MQRLHSSLQSAYGTTMSDAEDQLWATISDKPGSSIKKGQVKALLGLSTDDATEEWLKTRPHLFKVERSSNLRPACRDLLPTAWSQASAASCSTAAPSHDAQV